MVSTETLMPPNSNSFSAASVGPKSRYLSFRSNAIRVRTPSARRLFEARPRWRETTPASPCFFHACTRRLNWRTLIPSRSDASRCPKHSSNVWRTRCARSPSTMLIHNPNSTIRPPTAAATKRGHSNFGRWGHSYLGLTVAVSALAPAADPPYAAANLRLETNVPCHERGQSPRKSYDAPRLLAPDAFPHARLPAVLHRPGQCRL